MRNLFVLAAVFVALSVGAANADLVTDGSWKVQYHGTNDFPVYDAGNNSTVFTGILNGSIGVVEDDIIRVYGSVKPPSWYQSELGNHNWIGAYNGASKGAGDDFFGDQYGNWNLPGYYSFTSTEFDVVGSKASPGMLGIDFWNDNAILGIVLYKDGIFDRSWTTELAGVPYNNYENSTSLNINDLETGTYQLMFVLANGFPVGDPGNNSPNNDQWIGDDNLVAIGPVGLMVNVSVMDGKGTITPEPATFAVIGLGMLGAGFVARRRNRK